MSPPQEGIGRFWKLFSDRRRNSRIQSASPFIHDMSWTMSTSKPRFGLKT